MSQKNRFFTAALLLLFIPCFLFTQSASEPEHQAEFELRAVEIINQERINNGLPPFILDDTLFSLARSHSEDMVRNNFFGHTGSDRTTQSQRVQRGIPNAAAPFSHISANQTPEGTAGVWLSSSRADILNVNRTHIGVGFAQRPEGSRARYGNYWTMYITHILPVYTESEIQEFERRVFELTNIEREKNGLRPLIWHDVLSTAARGHSEDLMRNNREGHIGSGNTSPSQRVQRLGIPNARVGENVAYANLTPEDAVRAWMNSPGHRRNILNREYTHLGVGFVQRVEGSRASYVTYWTQKFGIF